MTTQPEALRLADLLEKAPAHTLEDGTITLYLGGTVVADKAAAELRRLSAENEAYGVHLSERMKDLAKVEAQRDALLEALRELLTDAEFLGWGTAKARAAIAKCEEDT